jgi:hypothetical protein
MEGDFEFWMYYRSEMNNWASTSVISADVHCKVSGKLGFVSLEICHKAVCFETTLKIFHFLHENNQ